MKKQRTISLRCPVCGMDTSDPKHRAWACQALLDEYRKREKPEGESRRGA